MPWGADSTTKPAGTFTSPTGATTPTPMPVIGGGTTPLNVPGANQIFDSSAVGSPGTQNFSANGGGGDAPWMSIVNQEMQLSNSQSVAYWTPHVENTQVRKYLSSCGIADAGYNAWCSAFVKWCLQQVGKDNSKLTASAGSSAQAFPPERNPPRYGAIVVMTSAEAPSGHHVAFFTGMSGGRVMYIGGNTGHKVGPGTHNVAGCQFYWPG